MPNHILLNEISSLKDLIFIDKANMLSIMGWSNQEHCVYRWLRRQHYKSSIVDRIWPFLSLAPQECYALWFGQASASGAVWSMHGADTQCTWRGERRPKGRGNFFNV